MYGLLDISASGLVAQRTRLEVATANVANMNTVADSDGNYAPFKRRIAILSAGDASTGSKQGVHVSKIKQSDNEFQKKYQPWHPFADANGYVNYPDIDPAIETINSMEAARAYEANIMAAEATKAMFSMALRVMA